MNTNDRLQQISDWIDDANAAKDGEAQLWGRTAKVAEEAGEVIAAVIGYTGQNPRKGRTHDREDVGSELLDTALTALAAWLHLYPAADVIAALRVHTGYVHQRAGLSSD